MYYNITLNVCYLKGFILFICSHLSEKTLTTCMMSIFFLYHVVIITVITRKMIIIGEDLSSEYGF
jgi:hypothetical protein